MKILLITANYEPGKDGVTDYVRLLAQECELQGHECSILAINDSFITKVIDVKVTEKLTALRLPKLMDDESRGIKSKSFISNFKPDVISIHMVSYSFHSRGFIIRWPKWFVKYLPPIPLEIMLHELWLGMARTANIKERINGLIQRYTILKLLKVLKPSTVHVSNNVFYTALVKEGYRPNYLPIFSNIPLAPCFNYNWSLSKLGIQKENRNDYLILTFFGTIHPYWDTNKVFDQILNLWPEKKIVVVSVGSQGYGKSIWLDLEKNFSDRINFKALGFLSEKEISETLQLADAGLCTMPESLIGKSGTTMAMLEHGLPIIIVRPELQYRFEVERNTNHLEGFYYLKDLNRNHIFSKGKVMPERIKEVANIFIKDISISIKK